MKVNDIETNIGSEHGNLINAKMADMVVIYVRPHCTIFTREAI
jgi:hypothetical protein